MLSVYSFKITDKTTLRYIRNDSIHRDLNIPEVRNVIQDNRVNVKWLRNNLLSINLLDNSEKIKRLNRLTKSFILGLINFWKEVRSVISRWSLHIYDIAFNTIA